MTDPVTPTSAPVPPAGPVNWTDPCQRAQALMGAYYKLLAGDAEIEIRTRTLDAEEVVRLQPGNLAQLRTEMQDAQDACAAQQAGRPQSSKRFAITARYLRGERRLHGRGRFE